MRARVVEDCLILSLHSVLREHRKGRDAPFIDAVSLDREAPWVRVRCEGARQDVQLTHHPHNIAGTRWYFRCDCGARTFTLYRPMRALRYRCRRCHGLRYRSENLSRTSRVEHRANKLAHRFGGSLLYPPTRPKGMWHVTFFRQREKVEAANLRALSLRLSSAA